MPIHVAIVEDDEDIRSSLVSLLERANGFCVTEQYSNAEAALLDLPQHKTDVILMDINLPGMDGVECVQQLVTVLPNVPVIMLTVYEDNERLFASLMAGANGYLLKRTPPAKLLEAIREVYAGGSPMTPEIARRVVQRMQTPAPAPAKMANLTPRERDVLEQLARGFRYKEITDNLGISMDTVRFNIRNIYIKLRVHSRTEAVVKYLESKE